MKDWILNVGVFLEKWGYFLGGLIVASPVVSDILLKGLRDGENVKVCGWGVVMQVVGFIVVGLGKYSKEWGRK